MGKSRAPTQQNISQTNLPEYVRPQFEALIKRAEGLSQETYQPFGGQRVATEGMGDINAAYDLTRNVAGSGIAGLPQAMDVMGSNVLAGQNIAQQAQPFQFTPAGQFTAETAQQYMSPYMQSVVDEQSRRAIQQFQEQGAGRATQAVQAGAFGGSRQGVQEAIAERSLMDQLGGIQATGLQNAFERGATQLQALGFSADQAQQMVGLGGMERAADIQGAQLLESIGQSQRGLEQQQLDMDYQDFVRQSAFPEQQLQFLSSILRGVPVQPGVTETAYAPFNPMQQLAGAGLAGLGLYRGMQ